MDAGRVESCRGWILQLIFYSHDEEDHGTGVQSETVASDATKTTAQQ